MQFEGLVIVLSFLRRYENLIWIIFNYFEINWRLFCIHNFLEIQKKLAKFDVIWEIFIFFYVFLEDVEADELVFTLKADVGVFRVT